MAKRTPTDPSQIAAVLVAKVTKTKLPKGDDLLLSPELQKRYDEAKHKEQERKTKLGGQSPVR